MRRAALALLLTACIGPQLVPSTGAGNTVWFSGREGFGYVTKQVMEERAQEAEAFAVKACDAGITVTGRRSDGRDNYIDFTCGEAGVSPPRP